MRITEIKIDGDRAQMRMDELGSFYYESGGILREWSVTSDSGNTYAVTETANDETGHDDMLRTWGCTCPAARYYPDRLCKHVRAVIDSEDDDDDGF
jgi:hypothetical protein